LSSPPFIAYIVAFLVFISLWLGRTLRRLEREMSDPLADLKRTQRDIALIPKAFLALEGIYCFFGPLYATVGKDFVDGIEQLLAAGMGVAITLSFTLPFFLKVDELLGFWTSGVNPEGEQSLGLRFKIFGALAGLAFGTLFLLLIATFAVVYEHKGSFTFDALKHRILPLFLSTSLLIPIIAAQMTRSLIDPLRKLVEALRSASEGEEEQPSLEVLTRDEIGQTAHWFNRLMELTREQAALKRTLEEDRDLESVYRRLYDLLREEFGLSEVVIYQVNNSRNRMQPVGEDQESHCSPEILVDISRCRAVRTAHLVNSFERRDICRSFCQVDEKRHICIPVVVGGMTGMVIQIILDPQADRREVQRRVRRLQRLISDVSSVVEAKRLLEQMREASLRDGLTGLHNRRFLQEYAEMLVAGARRKETRVGLLMCDLDHFKEVNDRYGHDVGDTLLKALARTLKETVRRSDLVIRYGGEEFLVVLTETSPEGAMEAAERIRQSVAARSIDVEGLTLSRTISIGVSVLPDDAENLWRCIRFADLALYRAKSSGRDRVVRFDPSMALPDEEGEEYKPSEAKAA